MKPLTCKLLICIALVLCGVDAQAQELATDLVLHIAR
jgi:hypothetical protein